jgi:hypothetical protein
MKFYTILFFLLLFFVPTLDIFADTTNVSLEVTVLQCSDGLDNDGDTLIDYPNDTGCDSVIDDDETDIFQCNDSIDNDSDGSIDFPADVGCSSATDDDETDPPSGGGGGGGGGGGSGGGEAEVQLSGNAFPISDIVVLRNGKEIVRTISGPDAKFKVLASGLSKGFHTFSIYGQDKSGFRSPLFTFPLTLTAGTRTEISGVFLAPTFTSDLSEVRHGDPIKFFGFTVPNSTVVVRINSETEIDISDFTDTNGSFLLNFNTTPLNLGGHEAKARAEFNNEFSDFGSIVDFIVSDRNIDRNQGSEWLRGDINNDKRVNLIDLSIAAFWYKKPLSSAILTADQKALNGDGNINLVDLSIMAFNWTG